jgi:hypothetical protein
MAADPQDSGIYGNRGAWTGWIIFAGLLLAITGFFDIFQGIAALTDDTYFAIREGQLLVFDFTTWGWILVIWGALLILGGIGLLYAKGWARWFAIVLACVNMLAQIGFLAAYPVWSTIVIALDVFVLFALTARWGEARSWNE